MQLNGFRQPRDREVSRIPFGIQTSSFDKTLGRSHGLSVLYAVVGPTASKHAKPCASKRNSIGKHHAAKVEISKVQKNRSADTMPTSLWTKFPHFVSSPPTNYEFLQVRKTAPPL
jgi:hypothetical protein